MHSTQYNFSRFISLSHEEMDFDTVLTTLFGYMNASPDREYRVVIGTDSEGHGEVAYATALVVHRVGQGGRAFICKNKIFTQARSLRHKIYNEAMLSLSLAQHIVPSLIERLGEDFIRDNLIVHVDVGEHGETKDMIREVVGMVRGFGFQVATKPDSYAASTVADRFSGPPKKLVPAAA